MKNVRSSQPCTSMNFVPTSVKHKFFHVSIVNFFHAKFYSLEFGENRGKFIDSSYTQLHRQPP